MSLIAKEKGGSTMELIPQGIHLAKCISIIDLWTQSITFEKQEKEVHQVRFEFELPTEKYTYKDKETDEEKTGTRIIWTNFTVSLNWKAKMKKFLESWRGKKFTQEELDWFNLWKILWKTCQLQIIHSEDWKRANIENALPLMKWVEVPKCEREEVLFSIEEDKKWKPTGFNEEIFNNLPEWLQNKIKESKEVKELYWITSIEDEEKEVKEKKEVSTKEVEDLFE